MFHTRLNADGVTVRPASAARRTCPSTLSGGLATKRKPKPTWRLETAEALGCELSPWGVSSLPEGGWKGPGTLLPPGGTGTAAGVTGGPGSSSSSANRTERIGAPAGGGGCWRPQWQRWLSSHTAARVPALGPAGAFSLCSTLPSVAVSLRARVQNFSTF